MARGFSPERLVIPYGGGTYNVSFETTNYTYDLTSWRFEETGSWTNLYNLQLLNYSSNGVGFRIIANENTNTVDCHCSFYVIGKRENSVMYDRYLYSFTIKCDPAKSNVPISDDTFFINGNKIIGESYDFKISVEDEDGYIYSGKCVALPDGTSNSILLNNICSPYLNSSFPIQELPSRWSSTKKIFQIKDYHRRFSIYAPNNIGNFIEVGSYKFYNSYDGSVGVVLSQPIKTIKDTRIGYIDDEFSVVDKRQILLCSLFDYDYDGLDEDNYIGYEKLYLRGYNNEIGETFDEEIPLSKGQTLYTQRLSHLEDGYVLSFETENGNPFIKYVVKETCADYCLYYCNAYGGWDSLLIYGNSLKTDKINSHYYTKSFDNTKPDFERKKYVNVITPKYTLYTDWFDDVQQSKMYHLLESTEVYLHNLKTDKIEPVNITNTTLDYKTFANNGKKKWYNKIDVEVAQDKIRR